MTARYILDTDHVSLLQRGDVHVVARIAGTPATDIAVTVITVEEQLQGRLAVVRHAKSQLDVARAYDRLSETVQFYASVPIIRYDPESVVRFQELRHQGIRIGTQDLRIAAIVLTQGAILITRNMRDFGRVPGLNTEDWSQ